MAASEKLDKDGGTGTPSAVERFDDILVRLRGVVEKLEGGNLSLEDSLKFFEEGIGLCRRGATILDSAERKVEVLLSGAAGSRGQDGGGQGGGRDGRTTHEDAAAKRQTGDGEPRTVPFDVPSADED